MEEIFHRVSIRKYQDRPVEEEKITKILKAAMAAPSACNQQPWEFYVVTDKEMNEKLASTSPHAHPAEKAPLVIVPCYRVNGGKAPAYFNIDMSAAVENMLLEIDSLGLGAVWMGISPLEERMEAVAKVLGVPESLKPFALVSCGYPDETKTQEDRYEEARIHYVKG